MADVKTFKAWRDEAGENLDPGFMTSCHDVFDIAEGAKIWLLDHRLNPTAADVIRLAELILAREVELERRYAPKPEEPSDDKRKG